MNRRALVAGLAALAVPSRATCREGVPLPRNEHGIAAARDVLGTVPWSMLISTSTLDTQTGPGRNVPPRFSAGVLALRDQTVRINGFMNPLEPTPTQRHFLLMAYPLTCPYCLSIGARFFVDVRAALAVAFTYDEVIVQGRLQVLDRDADGMLYRLLDARSVHSSARLNDAGRDAAQ